MSITSDTKLTAQHKLRVLMLTWEYPPRMVGGLGRAVCGLSRALVALGCDVRVLTSTYPLAPKHSIDRGVHVHWLDHEHLVSGKAFAIPEEGRFWIWLGRMNAAMVKEALRLHAEQPFDVIHAHDWLVNDAAQGLAHLNIPIVTSVHATEYGQRHGNLTLKPDSQLKDEYNFELLSISDVVIVNSKHMCKEVRGHFRTPTGLLNTIANGVDASEFECSTPLSALRKKHRLGYSKMVLFVGRLEEEKGIEELLRAAPAVLKEHPNAGFVIAGEGQMAKRLKEKACALGIKDRVLFFGKANNRDLSELHKLAEVQVVPSRYEPFGLVALEGMVAANPVVASSTGGLKDFVINGKTGYTFPPRDVDALAKAISFVLANKTQASKIGKAAQKEVSEKYSWHASALKTMSLYQSVLSHH